MCKRYFTLKYFGKLGLCLLFTGVLSLLDSPIESLMKHLFNIDKENQVVIGVIISKYVIVNLITLISSDFIIDCLEKESNKDLLSLENQCIDLRCSLRKLCHSYLDHLSQIRDNNSIEKAYKSIEENSNILGQEDIDIIKARYQTISENVNKNAEFDDLIKTMKQEINNHLHVN